VPEIGCAARADALQVLERRLKRIDGQ